MKSILFVGGSDNRRLRLAERALADIGEAVVASQAEARVLLPTTTAGVAVSGDGPGSDDFLMESARVRPDIARVLLPDGPRLVTDIDAIVLPEPMDARLLRMVCETGLRCAAAEREAAELRMQLGRDIAARERLMAVDEDLVDYAGLLFRSPAMLRIVQLLEAIEETDTTALITGETGTGKEVVAAAIHARSRRRNARFVAANLGSISDTLLESELFGHVRGAFTGATQTRGGLFAEADGGTIFLDEIGDASPALQMALLRVLEEGVITPVGADRPRPVDVRVISGTNRDLEALVREGRFRRDLYYRLHVFPVALPPLRRRREDIFPLANHFLARATAVLGKPMPGISRDARQALESAYWEGNVRQLRNEMERVAILCRGGLVVAADLPATMKPNLVIGDGSSTIAIPPQGAPLRTLEREIFSKTLALADGNRSRAARMLGIAESTLRFRLHKLGIGPAEADAESQSAATSQRAASC